MNGPPVSGTLVHGTCVALPPAGRGPAWAVLLRGASGAGKSDLALRLVDRGWRLVADDQVRVDPEGEALAASAPDTIAGRIEVRGLGIEAVPHLARARLCLLVDLVAAGAVERLPEPATAVLAGRALPLLRLHAFEVSAPVKLRLAAERAIAAIMAPGPAARDGAAAPGQRSRRVDDSSPAVEAAPAAGLGPAPRQVVLVTGLSGAGRTAALDILEDLGYEAVDNPPLDLLEQVATPQSPRPLAVGIDIRSRDFSVAPFEAHLAALQDNPLLATRLLFIDCEDEALRRRFTETRRRHPLAPERPLIDGIRDERRLVMPLRDKADLTIDTTDLKVGDLRDLLTGHFRLGDTPGMAVFVTSFSYKRGLPRAADLVIDVRFLSNPHYEPELRELTGRDPAVAAFISDDPGYSPFFARLTAMLEPLLPRYGREGKSYLTVALGCTGGRHRSVLVAERLAAWIEGEGYRTTLVHRDLAEEAER